MRNIDVMKNLLDFYCEKNDKRSFYFHAKIAFKKWAESFAEKIYSFIEFDYDNEFYLNVLEFLILENKKLELFIEFEKLGTEDGTQELIQILKREL